MSDLPKKVQRQCSIDVSPSADSGVPSISSHVSTTTAAASASKSQSSRAVGVLKRAMTLPVSQEEATVASKPQLLPHFNYAPLRSPMRSSKPLVPNSETSETLLDVPILINNSNNLLEEQTMQNVRTHTFFSEMNLVTYFRVFDELLR